ncbi:hypothetical protein [uncultured Rikenella sp.]|uniref:hypothetical protein n=1 Tax=uncultured Rikenella sp. TaxID=368003 RepID=UPI0026187FD8|nr:hypothetical protein [uncultured Rikenella sp.]
MGRYSRDIQLLIDTIGKEATLKVMANLGGMSLYITKPTAEDIAEALEAESMDAKAVSAKLKVSQSKVYRVLKELRAAKIDKRQLSIFDLVQMDDEVKL